MFKIGSLRTNGGCITIYRDEKAKVNPYRLYLEVFLDAGGMSYYKETDTHYETVCLFWVNRMVGEDGYNLDGDCWIGFVADGNTLDDAIEMLNTMSFEIVHPMRREEAEKELIKYMETH